MSDGDRELADVLNDPSYWQDVAHLITQVIRAPYREDGWFLSQNADATEFAVGSPPGFAHQPTDQQQLIATIVAPRLMSGDLVLRIEGINRFLRASKPGQAPAPSPPPSQPASPPVSEISSAPASQPSHLKTRCGGCGRRLRMLPAHVGKKTKCVCGSTLIVPSAKEVHDALPERLAIEPVDGFAPQPKKPDVQGDMGALDDSVIINRVSSVQIQRQFDQRNEGVADELIGGPEDSGAHGAMNREICDAVRDRAVLRFYYEGGGRVVEPHSHGVNTEGDEAIRVFQIGGYKVSEGSSGWRVFRVDLIFEMERTGATFDAERPGHDDDDDRMQSIHCRAS